MCMQPLTADGLSACWIGVGLRGYAHKALMACRRGGTPTTETREHARACTGCVQSIMMQAGRLRSAPDGLLGGILGQADVSLSCPLHGPFGYPATAGPLDLGSHAETGLACAFS